MQRISTQILFFCCLSLLPSVCRSDRPLDFSLQPQSKISRLGRRVQLKCTANRRDAQINWLFNGRQLPIDNLSVHIDDRNHRLSIQIPSNEHDPLFGMRLEDVRRGFFQCLAQHQDEAVLSRPAKLLIAKFDDFPPTGSGERLLNVAIGGTAVLTCPLPASVPNAVAEYELSNGNILDRSENRHLILPSGSLQIVNVQPDDAGRYRCIAFNPYLNERKNSSLFWHLRVESSTNSPWQEPMRFAVQPPSEVVAVRGSNVTLECAIPTIPAKSVRWKRLEHRPLDSQRHIRIGSNLKLIDLQRSDEGGYLCGATDPRGSLEARTYVQVQEPPSIIQPLHDSNFLMDQPVRLDCSAHGRPPPHYTWYFNAQPITMAKANQMRMRWEERGSILMLERASEINQGIYQCFVANDIATVHSSARLSLTSSMEASMPAAMLPPKETIISKRGGNNSSHDSLPIPGRPTVNRISSDSVMVRWNATTKSTGNVIPVSFYKLQYRTATPKNSSWITLEDDIQPHFTSYPVNGLRPTSYRFRVIAVFANNDQRVGLTSPKFQLLRNAGVRKPLHIPQIVSVRPTSPTSVEINWINNPYNSNSATPDMPPVNGYFINYRLTQSAESYSIITVEGAHSNKYEINHLQPGRQYEIKMQCYNSAGGSNFSRTMFVQTLPDTTKTTDESNEDGNDEEGDNGTGDVGDEDEDAEENGSSLTSGNRAAIPVAKSSTSTSTMRTLTPTSTVTTTSTTTTTTTTTTTVAPETFGPMDVTTAKSFHNLNHFGFSNGDQKSNEIDSDGLSNVDISGVDTNDSTNQRFDTLATTFNEEFFKQLVPIVAIAVISLLMMICCIFQCRRSIQVRRKRQKAKQQSDLMASKNMLYASHGSLRRQGSTIHSNNSVLANASAGNYMTIGANRPTLGGSRMTLNGSAGLIGGDGRAPLTLNGNIRNNAVYAMGQGTVGRPSTTKPLLQSNTVATLDRHRQRIRQFEDHYASGQQFATINRSNSFARLNGTLERKRRSRPDLFAVMDMKENGGCNTATGQPSWPNTNGIKQPIYGESKLNHYTITEEH